MTRTLLGICVFAVAFAGGLVVGCGGDDRLPEIENIGNGVAFPEGMPEGSEITVEVYGTTDECDFWAFDIEELELNGTEITLHVVPDIASGAGGCLDEAP